MFLLRLNARHRVGRGGPQSIAPSNQESIRSDRAFYLDWSPTSPVVRCLGESDDDTSWLSTSSALRISLCASHPTIPVDYVGGVRCDFRTPQVGMECETMWESDKRG